MVNTPPRIAIIGAGPAGSTLGRLLYLAGIPCSIFESEVDVHMRSQGGTLDLHADTGLAAIRRCKLYDHFLKYCRYDGDALVVADKLYRQYIWKSGSSTETKFGRPEIDRSRLRQILIDSLPAGMIKWDKRLKELQQHQDSYQLLFDDGSSEGSFDLVVGADGAFSVVRPLLSSAEPFFSGIGGVEGVIGDAENRHPELHKRVNRGSLFSFSDGKAIQAQQLGDGSLSVSALWAKPQTWVQDLQLDMKDGIRAKAEILKEYPGWDPRLTDFRDKIDCDTLVVRKLYMLPVGHSWKHKSGITLIGDAAHLMTPFSGEGVNFAMADAMKLAEAIIRASTYDTSMPNAPGPSLDQQVKLFEQDMFISALKYQSITNNMMIHMFFTPGAPYSSIERYVLEALRNILPWGTRWLAVCLVYSFYFVYKRLFLALVSK